MNRDYIDAHDVVGRYLRHELTDEEYTAFHLYLLQHPDFKKEVEAERHAYRALRARTVTTQRHATMTSPFKPRTLILLIVLVATGIWVVYRTIQPSAPTSPTLRDTPLLDTTPEVPVPNLPPPADTPSVSRPISPTTQPQRKAPSSPIAAADYTPNPYLEPYLDSGMRSSAYTVTVSLPDTLRLSERKVRLPLAYEWNTTQPLAGRILVFSNAPADYLDFRPLLTLPFDLPTTTAPVKGTFSIPVSLTPGLYYVLLEDRDTGEYWAVKRLIVVAAR